MNSKLAFSIAVLTGHLLFVLLIWPFFVVFSSTYGVYGTGVTAVVSISLYVYLVTVLFLSVRGAAWTYRRTVRT